MHDTRSQFTMTSLMGLARSTFVSTITDTKKKAQIPLVDCLMSALAVFTLKYDSLLQFDTAQRNDKPLLHNLRTLFGVVRAPCDTQMRERLDVIDLSGIRACMKALINRLQRSKVLEDWKFLGHHLIPLDGTGFFSSNTVHCSGCCEKHHSNGEITYHHQMLVGSIVNPNLRQVIPIGFEPIIKSDGDTKNDCERNAGKRWLKHFRAAHPQLSPIIVGDGLYSNAPFIKMLKDQRCHYILIAKEKDHKYLYDWFWKATAPDMAAFEEKDQGVHKRYRFMSNAPLNGSKAAPLVNVVYYEEQDAKGELKKWLWVTDLEITEKTVRDIVKGGRARWKIENETFNSVP